MEIDGHRVAHSEPAFVIAEAGSNHNGDFQTAMELIDAAVEAGADAVKFQVFRANDLYVEDSGTDQHVDSNLSIYETIDEVELPREWIPELREYCEQRDITFLATPFDDDALDILSEHVPVYKIASSSVTHLPFLKTVGATGKPVLMSTGFHRISEVRRAVETLREAGTDELALFHCVGAYPTPLDQINVRAIDALNQEFSVPVGLSDHTTDPVVAPCTAVSRGASMVEKHFTLDRSMEGPDHSFALEPDELSQMISEIRRFESALGDGDVTIQEVEEHVYNVARRSVHATKRLQPGDRITPENTKILRPGTQSKGIAPSEYEELIGAKVIESIESGEGIDWEVVDKDDR